MLKHPELAELSGQIEAIELSSRPRHISLTADERLAIDAIRRRHRALAPRRRRVASKHCSNRQTWIAVLAMSLGIALLYI